MNPLLRAMLRSSSATPPYVPPVSFGGPGINAGEQAQYYGNKPYINHMKSRYADESAGTTDANGYLATLGIGATCYFTLWELPVSMGPVNIKAGNWLFRWTGPNTNVGVVFTDSPGVSNVVRGVNRVTFDYDPTVLTSGLTKLRMGIVNNTASTTLPITATLCCPTAWETLYDGGQIISPDYLDALPTNLAVYRTMASSYMWFNGADKIANIRPKEASAWVPVPIEYLGPTSWTTGEPYEIGAQMAIEIGCDLHCCFPMKGDQATYDYIAGKLYAVLASHPEVHVITEFHNENWNGGNWGGLTTAGWLQNVFGVNFTPNLLGPQAESHKALMCWKAMENAGFPRPQIIRTLAMYEAFDFNPGSGYNWHMLEYTDPGIIQGGAKVKTLVDRVVTAPYTHINLGAGPLYHSRLSNIDWVNTSDVSILGWFHTDNVAINGRMLSFVANVASVSGRNAASLPVGSYEWGQEVTHAFQNDSGVFYQFDADLANNKCVFTVNFPANYDDGDEWSHQSSWGITGNGGWFTQAFWDAYNLDNNNQKFQAWIRHVDGNSCRFYDSQAKAVFPYANDAAASAAAYPVNVAGTYVAYNWTRHVALINRMTAFLDSASGRTMYEELYSMTVGPGLMAYPTQYHDFAGYSSSFLYMNWGLMRGHLQTPTPRYQFYRDL